MSQEIQPYYDVIIMGGGPAGSTLGAQLKRTSNLSVVLFEKDVHPREHIGESLAHPTLPAMEQIGVLPKLLEKEFWVQKFGGIFKWDDGDPSVNYFDHPSWEEDGVHRWTAHVNRSEFDHMLLEHAKECGVEVFESTSVTAFTRLADGVQVTLKDGTVVRGGFFADASGRKNSIAAGKTRAWLSEYKNIALWQHFEHCQSGYTLEGDWNIFREKSISPITCSAYQDGWCWFIPVPKIIDGERRMTHSVGIVTNPSLLKEEGKDLTDPATFQAAIKQIPLIQDLIKNATPVGDKVHTATNYSMINDQFVNYDERWVLLGDAAYFVDPLFSSGVAFAMHHALSAALLIKTSADSAVPEQYKRDLWRDYDREWHAIAQSFSLSIDQWYHAIGKNNPESVYWTSRGQDIDLDLHEGTFQALLSTSMHPDLYRNLTKGAGDEVQLDQDGPYMRAYRMALQGQLSEDTMVALAPNVVIRKSLAVELPGFKGFVPEVPFRVGSEERAALAAYWRDPVAHGGDVPNPTDQTLPCHRFCFTDAPDGENVCSIDGLQGGLELWKILCDGPIRYGNLSVKLTGPQQQLLGFLLRTGMVTTLDDSAAAKSLVAAGDVGSGEDTGRAASPADGRNREDA